MEKRTEMWVRILKEKRTERWARRDRDVREKRKRCEREEDREV